jgi:CubicO group peptidase (beta-lactamase class C family)
MRWCCIQTLAAVACVLVAATSVDAQPVPDPLAALERGLRASVALPGTAPPRWSLAERMRHYHVPGVAIAIVRNAAVVQATGYGVRAAGTVQKVDGDTLFSVGSISKVITATTTLRLAAAGRLDLDRDVGTYLKRWQLPPSPGRSASLRMLMSHTAGLGVHGFADYGPADPLPTLVQVLDGVKPAKNEAVRFKHAPGTVLDYSGGGVTVEQMVLEDATGCPLADLARTQVFGPLGMTRSTFDSPAAGSANIARAHDARGAPTALPRGWESFAEAGASGLWTSARDLGRLVGGLIGSYQGKTAFLPQALATTMMTEVAPGVFGLGPRLGGSGAGRYFFHMGANESYLSFMEGYLETGDGFVILTNGSSGMPLVMEIRNALADAFGLGAHPEVRGVALRLPPAADLAGRYQRDAAVPPDVQRSLADNFDHAALQVELDGNAVQLRVSGTAAPLALVPLGPAQFVHMGLYAFVVEFRRDAWGAVRGVTVSMPEAGAVAHYVRAAGP